VFPVDLVHPEHYQQDPEHLVFKDLEGLEDPAAQLAQLNL
jgi:hypothetical protein